MNSLEYAQHRPSKLNPWVAGVAFLVMGALFVADVAGGLNFNIAILYPTVLFACWWSRDRRLLWWLTFVAIVLTFAALRFEEWDLRSLVHRVFAGAQTILTAALFRYLIGAWDETMRRSDELSAGNVELAAREEEIARQNEELQSQTEELERQSEELRVANDELARRERTLSILLDLSRGLSIEMPRGETLDRICQTLAQLIEGPEVATAVLERRGEDLHVACFNGFGPGGLARDTIPLAESFASLVFARDQTGYIEDLSLRPDLSVPQPRSGPPMVSAISTPLRVGGAIIGAIEGYGTERRPWTVEQVALIESIASQAAATLRSEGLFEQVTREQRKFETIFRLAPVGMALLESGATVARFNPSGAAMLGCPTEFDLRSGDGPDLSRPHEVTADGQRSLRMLAALESGEEITLREADVVLPSNRRLSILYSVAPIRGNVDASATVAAFVDVTQMKELQRELDLRRREAEEASVRKTRFLAAVSHDVRTPANAISLLAELIRRTAGLPGREAEIADMAKELHSSAMALVSLLGDVLDVTRFDAGRIELQESEFDLRALLSIESQHLMPLAREKGLQFTLDDGPPLWLRADKIKLARVIGNLVGNAIKFTERGAVRLSYGRADDARVRVSVTDSGIGIAPEHLAYIFDEFFQLRNPERDRNKGNGLGLTICKRLADVMGAELKVDSRVAAGSTFTLLLPASAVISH